MIEPKDEKIVSVPNNGKAKEIKNSADKHSSEYKQLESKVMEFNSMFAKGNTEVSSVIKIVK